MDASAGRRSGWRRSWSACTSFGFFILIALVAPYHYRLGASGTFTVGLGLTAYTLGLRHAFDADHIAAIDNTTRKLMSEGERPLSVGFFFSLGHSSGRVRALLLFALGLRGLDGQVRHGGSTLHAVTSVIGTGVSGGFLYVIAALNLVILIGLVRAFGRLRHGSYDEAAIERELGASRGALNRVYGRFTRAVPAAVADVPARNPVRAGLRHRQRGGAAVPGRRRGRGGAAVLRDPVLADPVRRRDVVAGHDRRLVHELRL